MTISRRELLRRSAFALVAAAPVVALAKLVPEQTVKPKKFIDVTRLASTDQSLHNCFMGRGYEN